MTTALALAPVLLALSSVAPGYPRGEPLPISHPGRAAASPAPSSQTRAVQIYVQFSVTPYCTLSPPASGAKLSFGSATGNTAARTLFQANLSLNYFCDLGVGGDDAGSPRFGIADAAATGSTTFVLRGVNRNRQIDYKLCPAAAYGGGSCSANYVNNVTSSATPLASGRVIPLIGYFRTQGTPLGVDSYNDDLTAVIYF